MKNFLLGFFFLTLFSNLGMSQAKFIPTIGWDVSFINKYGSLYFNFEESPLEMSSLALGLEVESQLAKKFSGSIKSSWTSKSTGIHPWGFSGIPYDFAFGYLKNSVNVNYNVGPKFNVGMGVGLNILFNVRTFEDGEEPRVIYSTFKHFGIAGSTSYSWKRIRASVNLFQGFTNTSIEGAALLKPFTSIELAVGYIIGIKLGN